MPKSLLTKDQAIHAYEEIGRRYGCPPDAMRTAIWIETMEQIGAIEWSKPGDVQREAEIYVLGWLKEFAARNHLNNSYAADIGFGLLEDIGKMGFKFTR